ncbi:uncharacterized protein isoform X14 [Leptinotarsa decemlineata]|uniref:uncharacterized protein isoform X14 n=1 Tax=Leptinotarsa decemlineata TaxID=7539 RepID=UPI003D3049D2
MGRRSVYKKSRVPSRRKKNRSILVKNDNFFSRMLKQKVAHNAKSQENEENPSHLSQATGSRIIQQKLGRGNSREQSSWSEQQTAVPESLLSTARLEIEVRTDTQQLTDIERFSSDEDYLEITKDRPDDGAEIKSEPDDQILQPVPECSSRNPEEYLPENPPIANHAKDVAKQSIPKRHFGKVVCRMCLESAAKTQMVPLTTWDVNYAGRSEAYKQNKILQTERVNSMINVVMPNFDFDIAYNPMICHKCVARLESAFNFIEECKESEKVIHSYKTKFASHQELVSCDDVAQNRRLLEKEESRRKRRKSSKQHDNDRLVTSSPLGQNESISAGDTSQVEVHEFERVDCGESQESITMETNSEIMTSIKSEREDLECDDSEGNSFLINTADLTSVIVKEEVSVKEEVPCDFNDLPTNDQHCDLIVKDEAYSLTIAYGTDENDEYHRDSALSRKRKEMDPGT